MCMWTSIELCQWETGCWSRATMRHSKSSRSQASWSRSGRPLLQLWMNAAPCWKCLPASTRKLTRYIMLNNDLCSDCNLYWVLDFLILLCSVQYMSKVEPWCKACGEGDLPSELQDLEDTIHHHQGLYEHITTAYSEVSSSHVDVCTHHKTNMDTLSRPFFLLLLTSFCPSLAQSHLTLYLKDCEGFHGS